MTIPVYSTPSELSPYPSVQFLRETPATAESLPALPATLIRLSLLHYPQFVDLDQVAGLVRSDVGMTLAVLLAARKESGEDLWRISDCMVTLDGRLDELAQPLVRQPGLEFEFAETEAFWMHARLVAAIAEAAALFMDAPEVHPEQAYLAGLLHNLRRLPEVLLQAGHRLSSSDAESWIFNLHLPSFLEEAVNRVHEQHDPRQMSPMVRTVNFAIRWLELCLPWPESCMARSSHFMVPRQSVSVLIEEYFPELDSIASAALVALLTHSTLDQFNDADGLGREREVLPHPDCDARDLLLYQRARHLMSKS